MRDVTLAILAFIAGALLALLIAFPAQADHGDGPYILTVDGQEYEGTVAGNGHTVHFETPDTDPQSAFTDRNVWNGVNGAENLPCDEGIHWVDNNNLLTVSHCIGGSGTTTTSSTSSTTSTTIEDTTTTTEQETTTSAPSGSTTTSVTSPTTTTQPSTTTSTSDTSTTSGESEDTTTTTMHQPHGDPEVVEIGNPPLPPKLVPEPDETETLPFTGMNVPLLMALGLMLTASGGYLVRKGASSNS